jgi:alpha-galactosidase
VVNAVQIGGYKPATVLDFEIPKKYGLRQTIADTLGIGGIMRGLRTLPFLREVAEDMEAVAPRAWLLNYTNPMSILSGYMQRYTLVETVGLCHSVQVCSEHLLKDLAMDQYLEGRTEVIAGINHMGWLLKLEDKHGEDIYPKIKEKIREKQKTRHPDMVRYEYVGKFG